MRAGDGVGGAKATEARVDIGDGAKPLSPCIARTPPAEQAGNTQTPLSFHYPH
jgi:hypothetical protein